MFKRKNDGVAVQNGDSQTASPKKGAKLKNTIALKRNVYAVILSVVFIVAVVLLTVLATALADRYPLDIDLTTDGVHTMTSDNVDYIKSVDKKVNIYVCLPEDAYACNTSGYNMHYYAAVNYFVDYKSDIHGSYFNQTVEMLKKYTMYNDNISVTYLDITQPSAKEITDNFDDFQWTIGDILIECSFEANGETITRRTHIPFSEIYTLDSDNTQVQQYYEYYMAGYAECYALYGYGIGYNITENNIEYALSSAIYKVTSENTPVFLVPNTYCNTDNISAVLEQTLTSNNYSVQYTDGLLSSLLAPANYDAYAGIILADCTSDISEADRDALEKFLDNNGKKGKSLFYFAGTNTYKLTNLRAFLGDWGIGFESGILYETTGMAYVSDNPTNIYLGSLETDYTEKSDAIAGKYHIASDIVPMTQLYPKSTTATYTRSTTVILRTASGGTTTVMPIDANVSEWKPSSDAVYDAYPVAIFSEDADTTDDGKYIYSSVVAYASSSYISEKWANTSYTANLNFTLDTFNAASGVSDTPFSFVAKTITNENYLARVTAGKTKAIKIIFMAAVPIALVGVGMFVWIRRKRK